MIDSFLECLKEEDIKKFKEFLRRFEDAYSFAVQHNKEKIAIMFDKLEILKIEPLLRNKLSHLENEPEVASCKTYNEPKVASCKPYNELEATVPLMLSDDYKARFVGEYRQTKYRYERLKAFCNRIEAARMTPERDEIEEPTHDCPLELLRNQQRAMGEYLHMLEIRAVIEQIEL